MVRQIHRDSSGEVAIAAGTEAEVGSKNGGIYMIYAYMVYIYICIYIYNFIHMMDIYIYIYIYFELFTDISYDIYTFMMRAQSAP